MTKTLGQGPKEKLASMIRMRKGLGVDSGAADLAILLGLLALILLMASLGSLRVVHYVSANGASPEQKGAEGAFRGI